MERQLLTVMRNEKVTGDFCTLLLLKRGPAQIEREIDSAEFLDFMGKQRGANVIDRNIEKK